MKTLMLDFDGVLHPTTVGEEGQFCRLRMIDAALAAYDCDLVFNLGVSKPIHRTRYVARNSYVRAV